VVVIDDQEFRTDPGTIDVRVYNVASQAPTTLGTLVASDTIGLVNQSRALYLASFDGVSLVAGNHYALVVSNPSKAGVTVGLLGQLGGAYSSGDAISSSDSGVNVSNITGDDAFFALFVQVDTVPTAVRVKASAEPGKTEIDIFSENPSNETFLRYHVHRALMGGRVEEWDIAPFLLYAGEDVELMAQHDRDSQVSWLHVSVRFRFAPVTIYG